MSYTLNLHCGCVVYVSVHPETQIPQTRTVQTRGSNCGSKRHAVGSRLYLWELLPDRRHAPAVAWMPTEHARSTA